MGRRNKNVGYAKNTMVKKFTVVSIVGVCVALIYLWQHTQLIRVGYDIRNKEKKLSAQKKENQCLRLKICQLKSPRRIEKMIAAKELNLGFTKNWQYVYIRPDSGEIQNIMKPNKGLEKFAAAKRDKKISYAPVRNKIIAGIKKADG